MNCNEEKIIIAGGGIGGLTTALALRQKGFDVSVFEQADELREIGAGLSVWANATQVMDKLGLLDKVLERGAVLESLQMRTQRGELISEIKTIAEFETPAVCIHRAELLSILKERIPKECIHLGEKIQDFREQEGLVIADSSTNREVKGHALIGADGLNSNVRAKLLGRSKPIYRGYWSWRGITHFALPEEHSHSASETWGNGQRFGIEPMGRGRVFWYATANAPEGNLGKQSEWKDELRRKFKGWHSPIPELIEATPQEAVLKHETVDRTPFRRWGRGRVTLLGDAAHPTTPNLGQGACMAMEDAFVLAKCLASDEEMAARLRRYEKQRFKRTALITRDSHRVGWVGQIENSLVAALRNAAFKMIPKILMNMRHRQYYLFNE
jgi:2-polyprenyl-6-methoxyphenol hydroxylase-like FAD-dependent oxidoreductase